MAGQFDRIYGQGKGKCHLHEHKFIIMILGTRNKTPMRNASTKKSIKVPEASRPHSDLTKAYLLEQSVETRVAMNLSPLIDHYADA